MKHLLKTFAVLMMAAIAFSSCTKEKEPTTPQQDNRKPLAMRDNSGKIINLIDVEELQAFVNSKATKDEQIVIESYSITDKTDDDPFFFTIYYIDAATGEAYATSFIGNYVEENTNYFYTTDEVKRGNTDIKCPNGEVVKFVNGQQVEPEPCYQAGCGIMVKCHRKHCTFMSCRPAGSHGDYYCTDCMPKPGYEMDQTTCYASVHVHNGLLGILFDWLMSL